MHFFFPLRGDAEQRMVTINGAVLELERRLHALNVGWTATACWGARPAGGAGSVLRVDVHTIRAALHTQIVSAICDVLPDGWQGAE